MKLLNHLTMIYQKLFEKIDMNCRVQSSSNSQRNTREGS